MAKFLRIFGNDSSWSGPGTSTASSCLEVSGVRRIVLPSAACRSSAADATAQDTAAKDRPTRARGRLLRAGKGAAVVIVSPMGLNSIMAGRRGNRKQKMVAASEAE